MQHIEPLKNMIVAECYRVGRQQNCLLNRDNDKRLGIKMLVMSVKYVICSYHIVVVVGHEKLGGVLVDATVVKNLKERLDEEPSSLLLLED